MSKVESQDLIRYGLIPEFVGRLPVTSVLGELDEEMLVKILSEPRNALTKQYEKLFAMENVALEFHKDALAEVAKEAINCKSGARGLRSILEHALLDVMYDLPGKQGVEKVIIDAKVIKHEGEPLYICAQDKDDKQQQAS